MVYINRKRFPQPTPVKTLIGTTRYTDVSKKDDKIDMKSVGAPIDPARTIGRSRARLPR